MYDFDYQRPASVDEALKALGASEDAKLLAGGQTLIPTLKQRLAQPTTLIDLRGIAALRGVTVSGDGVTVGAATPHAEVAGSKEVRAAIPALADLAEAIGDPQVRHRGTLGGSIANNDPAADYPGAVLGLGATVKTNRREITADGFFTGMFETALDEDEIVTAVVFPKPQAAAYAKFPNPASRYAMVGVFVARTAAGTRVAVTGAGPCVFRATEMEQALDANFSIASLDGIPVDGSDFNEDIHATAEYRAHLVGVMAKRAVAAIT